MSKAIAYLIVLCSSMMALAAPSNSAPFERPLVFEPNLGQAPAQFSWTARGAGYQIYLTSSGAKIVTAEPLEVPSTNNLPAMPGTADGRSAGMLQSRVSVMGMNLAGSHNWSAVEGLQPTGGVGNYLVGKDRKDWHTGIPQYARVRVKGVYDGIDLVFYGNGRELEYDFVIAPESDAGQIRLAFDGAAAMRVDSQTGDLMIKTPSGGEMRHIRPRVYQQIGDRTVEVAGAYKILANGQAAFRLADYDRRSTLTVDPQVRFINIFGGSANDYVTGVAVNESQTYVTGQTYSTDFPTTEKNSATRAKTCVQNVCPAYIFVTSLSSSGAIIDSTLIGGSGTDQATGITVDSSGVFISGTTNSQNFSTHPAFGLGFWNGFIAKISPGLSVLDWCVTFGGNGDQYVKQGANAIAVDSKHAVYAAGATASSNFPVSSDFSSTLKAKQKTLHGSSNAFVVKVDQYGYLDSGYATYLGGSKQDAANGLAVDSVGHAFVTGYTTSKDFPTNSATSHGSLANGGSVAFITELSKDGSKSLYSVLLGGTKSVQHPYPLDMASAIILDASNEAFVTGTTCTSDFPTDTNAYEHRPPSACLPQTAGQFYQSAFVAKLDPTGKLLHATYLGATKGYVNGYSIAIDKQNIVYAAGITSSTEFPGNRNELVQPTKGFVIRLDPKLQVAAPGDFMAAAITSLALYTQEVLQGPTTVYYPVVLAAGYATGAKGNAFVSELIY